MACNTCKKSTTYEKISDDYKKNQTKTQTNFLMAVRDNTIKIFVFLLLSVIFIPLVIPATLYTLFVTVFTDKGINIVPLGLYIGKKLFNDKEEDDEDDDDLEDEEYDDLLDENEYELDENEITVIK